MPCTEIAIVGGGLAGSTAAAMLGRAGVSAVVIDPHRVYPPDFRAEKILDSQVPLLHNTGLADAVLSAATPDEEVWVARFGRLVERMRHSQYNILYDTLVNALRAEIPPHTDFICAKVVSIIPSADSQRLVLSNGTEISARLVILANGLNTGLRHSLGMKSAVLSKCHSISIGFDVEPVGRAGFDFRALTYHSEQPASRIAYLTLFLIRSTMRANLFLYRDLHDPWLRQFREAPAETLFAALPGLRSLTGSVEVPDGVKIRPVDLYGTENYRQAGIVLVGDAFATSCPAAGTGLNKVFTDVERLCHVYIPQWLSTPGMGEHKIAAFYEDPVKIACDEESLARAYFTRSLSIDAGFAWRTRRMTRYVARRGISSLRRAREQWSSRRLAVVGPKSVAR